MPPFPIVEVCACLLESDQEESSNLVILFEWKGLKGIPYNTLTSLSAKHSKFVCWYKIKLFTLYSIKVLESLGFFRALIWGVSLTFDLWCDGCPVWFVFPSSTQGFWN